jgi:hypothetical protein
MPVPAVGAAAAAAPSCTSAPASPGARFDALLAAHRPPAPPPPSTPAARLASAVQSLEVAQARLDRVLQSARAGRTFTAGELLALQSDAYRFTQAMDVASKLVEHGVQTVKQAVNAQV